MVSFLGEYYISQEAFEESLTGIIWLTYKKGFRPLLVEKKEHLGKKIDNLSTDCGWGCTIRSG
jgi:hypothetical protein